MPLYNRTTLALLGFLAAVPGCADANSTADLGTPDPGSPPAQLTEPAADSVSAGPGSDRPSAEKDSPSPVSDEPSSSAPGTPTMPGATPTEPAASNPANSEPNPTPPAATSATPTDPAPTDPRPSEPPAVGPPATVDPVTVDPVTVDPVTVDPVTEMSPDSQAAAVSALAVAGARPVQPENSWSGDNAQLPVAAAADGSVVYVAYNDAARPSETVVAGTDGSVITIPDAAIGGVTATADGVGVLLFDPAPLEERRWAAVARYDAAGTEIFRTELFNSPNLEDEDSKGEPTTSRLAYLAGSDTLIAYFGHTQRYGDGVRHQGGYLAAVSATGQQDILNPWFGSHNLDQRLAPDGDQAYVLGLGDAYPEGIFFGATGNLGDEPTVIQPVAAAGNGATNAQLGGIVNLMDQLVIPFITNTSIPPDLDAGVWPNIDDAISMRIRDAAANGTDMGLMAMPKSMLARQDTALAITWLEVGLADGARLEWLKSAAFGSSPGLLLAWAEASGDRRNRASSFYSMVVEPTGNILRDKSALGPGFELLQGDDIIPLPDGSVTWANAQPDGIHLVTLKPE